jgi:photosystem II stability/assembly factor-like uncharacterized protein
MRHRQQRDRRMMPLAGILGLLMVSALNAQDVATTTETAASTVWPDPATSPAQMLSLEQIEHSLLLDATNARDRAVVVGDRGHILVSESRSEWRQVASPTRSMLTALAAVGNKLWAVGHDQVVIYSSDGGLTWTLQHHDIEAEGPLLDVIFLDEERGYAIGAYGQFLSTTDSGANWTVELISDRVAAGAPADQADNLEIDPDSGLASSDMGMDEGDPHLNAIVRNSLGLLIVGETGSAYRSTDDGLSWVRGNLPYEGSMFGAVALDNDSIIAFGLRGNAFATGDLGRTWRQLETGTEASLLGGAAVSGSRAVLVGAGGTVLLLPAGSDQMRAYTFSDGGVMSGVLPLSETDFLTVGENGVATYQPN